MLQVYLLSQEAVSYTHLVTDQGAREGNYLESSATALFIYTLAKAINKGYICLLYTSYTQHIVDKIIIRQKIHYL